MGTGPRGPAGEALAADLVQLGGLEAGQLGLVALPVALGEARQGLLDGLLDGLLQRLKGERGEGRVQAEG